MCWLPPRRWTGSILFLALLALLLAAPVAVAQRTFPRQEMRELHNSARLANGVGLLAWNETLAEAAQRHAEEIAVREDPSHIGSDGSTPQQRAERLGYGRYPDAVRVSENWSTGSALEVMAFFLEDQVYRDKMLLPIWREMGVGHAETTGGGELWVVLYGAQPGVLPLFINEDAPRSTTRSVQLALSQEEAGQSESLFTTAVEVRVGEPDTLAGAVWQPWQATLPFDLSPEGGEKTVLVEYRDTLGHVVQASDTIFLIVPDGPVPTSLAQLAPTLTPSATPTLTPTPTVTPTPTLTPTPTITPTPTPRLFSFPPKRTDSLLLCLGGVLLGGIVVFLVALALVRRRS